MNHIPKIVLSSSVVLAASLFSLGCGGDSGCCSRDAVVAEVSLLASNNFVQDNILPTNVNTLTVNGASSSSNGTINKAVWTVYESCDNKNTIIDGPKTVTTKDQELELNLGTPGQHQVCVVITDTNGLSDEDCKCVTVQPLDGPAANISGLPQTLKVGCPLPTPTGESSVTNSGSNTLTYAWTLDDNAVGSTVTPTLPDTLTATPNPHVVCLTVTDSNGLSDESCQNVNIIPHVAPTAIMRVWNHLNADQVDIPAGSTLSKSTQYDLSCAGSQDDCPSDTDGEEIECTWNASSYKAENGSCDNVPEPGSTRYYIENCFDDAEHTGHGVQTTTPNTDTALLSYITLCGSPTEFDCVKVTMTATDKLHGDLNTTVTKVFNAQ